MSRTLTSLMSGGYEPDDDLDFASEFDLMIEELEERGLLPEAPIEITDGVDDPDHSDRRKEWLENYCPVETDELPY